MKKLFTLLAILIANISSAQNPSFNWVENPGGGQTTFVDNSGNVYSMGFFTGTLDFDPGAGTYTLNSTTGAVFVQKLNALGNLVWAVNFGAGGGIAAATSIAVDASGNVYLTGGYQGTTDFDPSGVTFNLICAGIQDAFISKLNASGNFVWAKSIGGTSNADRGTSIVLDASSNVYTTGFYWGTVDFDPNAGTFNMTSAGLDDIFVSKLDASGNFVWAKSMGGAGQDEGNGITIDGGNNLVSTGYFTSAAADFDPGAGTFTLSSPGGSGQVYASELDASGNFVWAKSLGGTGYDVGRSVKTDASNNVYITGYFAGTGDFDPGAGTFNLTSFGSSDVFISKLNSAGNFVWANQLGGTGSDYGKSITVDPLGNVYTVGQFNVTADFDPGAGTYTITSLGIEDVFISKLNSTGNFIWAGAISGSNSQDAFSIALDANSSLYIAGMYTGLTDFDAGAGTYTLSASESYLTKYCQVPQQPSVVSGPTTVCAGSSQVYTLSPLPGATSYTWNLPGGWSGASSTNTISATPGTTGVFSVTANNACGASPQQTLNVTVNPLPTINASSSTSMLCVGQTATLTASGASTYTWNPGGTGTSISVSPTVTTTYTIAGTSTAGCNNSSSFTQSVSTCAGIDQISNSISEINVYPNPFNDHFLILGGNGQTVSVFNALGSLIYKGVIEQERFEINLEKEPGGIYFVKIGGRTKKGIKE